MNILGVFESFCLGCVEEDMIYVEFVECVNLVFSFV